MNNQMWAKLDQINELNEQVVQLKLKLNLKFHLLKLDKATQYGFPRGKERDNSIITGARLRRHEVACNIDRCLQRIFGSCWRESTRLFLTTILQQSLSVNYL